MTETQREKNAKQPPRLMTMNLGDVKINEDGTVEWGETEWRQSDPMDIDLAKQRLSHECTQLLDYFIEENNDAYKSDHPEMIVWKVGYQRAFKAFEAIINRCIDDTYGFDISKSRADGQHETERIRKEQAERAETRKAEEKKAKKKRAVAKKKAKKKVAKKKRSRK